MRNITQGNVNVVCLKGESAESESGKSEKKKKNKKKL